jgi:hypothetical protein
MSMIDDTPQTRALAYVGSDRRSERQELRQVLAALGAGLLHRGAERDLPGIFEQELQRVLCARTVRLREIQARYQARLVTPMRAAESVVLGVPTPDPRLQAVLEAWSEPGRPFTDADFDLLLAAAQLGGLVLEAERVRQRGRARLPDGAAPLVGSSAAMQALRERIERVALTDFTVLIEGPIDP